MKPINLNQARKARAKAAAKVKADENALRFGRSRAEKAQAAEKAAAQTRHLDQHKREPE